MLKGSVPYSKSHDQAFREHLVRPLETVEKWLATRTFLVGERLSSADITAATVLRGPSSSILGKAERAKYLHTIRYYETVVNHPKIGRPRWCGAGGIVYRFNLASTCSTRVPKHVNFFSCWPKPLLRPQPGEGGR